MLPLKPRQLLEVATQGLRSLDFAAVADPGQVRDAEIGAADGQVLACAMTWSISTATAANQRPASREIVTDFRTGFSSLPKRSASLNRPIRCAGA